ncbi:MAG TPA: LuxR C-terminal-related transcriptional regulator [Pseudonocardiaceae bacterium]|nr:LuxR C-terminal-related transcriptional regulator [Pseudonocardiaceae bacterium]
MAWDGRPSVEVTSYVGRQRELAEARRLLSAGPLLTLCGAGGVGKTRLAARIMADLGAGSPDGAALVRLAELRDPELLASVVANELGLYDLSSRAAVQVVIDHLRDRAMLLVLDNCEHLIAACGAFVHRLVHACPRLIVLTTSRQSLGIAGEQVLQVPPLGVPDASSIRSAAELAQHDGVRLFVDRAQALVPSFTVTEDNFASVAELCERLEGLPLAIELAAVRIRSLSPRQIAERLSDRFALLTGGGLTTPARQQTLRATIDWTYELCSDPERQVWTRASVFSGTFDLPAAEQVCAGAGVDRAAVLDLIDGLLDKSVLIREGEPDEVRYRMLETLREYGQQRLEESGDRMRVARRHRDWFADLCSRFAAEWIGPAQIEWTRRMRRENANIRVALDFCATAPGEAVVGMRMDRDLGDYIVTQWLVEESRVWLDRLSAGVPADAPERVTGLRRAGWVALFRGDATGGVTALTQAGELAARTHNDVEAAFVATGWGIAGVFSGHPKAALEPLESALRTFQRTGVERGVVIARFVYGMAIGLAVDLDRGRAIIAEQIQRCADLGDIYWRGWCLSLLAGLEVRVGDPAAAVAAARQAVRLTMKLDHPEVRAYAVEALADATARLDDHRRAAALYGVADTMWALIGQRVELFPSIAEFRHRCAQPVRLALTDAGFERELADGRGLPAHLGLDFALGEPVTAPVVRIRRDRDLGALTRRQSEIAELVARGLSNGEIAERLVVSKRTAETHVQHILAKLGFSTRAQIAAWYTAGSRDS